eukprot:GABW01004884.1.p2 GENE.GABW01004884.1~~GABW01004884.1.p2  ORF type:complete len:56 (+),score=0.12 GABW01004884.1:209-376(+)
MPLLLPFYTHLTSRIFIHFKSLMHSSIFLRNQFNITHHTIIIYNYSLQITITPLH